MAKLIVLDGPRGGEEIDLSRAVTLGRHSENTVSIPDEGVSKRHASIELRGEGHHVVDLGSLNGTYLNRRRVKEAPLRHRDEVRIGTTRMLFVDPRQARQLALGLSIPLQEDPVAAPTSDLESETTAVFRLPEVSEPDELGQFMREFEKLHMAFRVGAELTGLLEEGEVGQKVLEKIFEILPADRGCVFLRVPGSSELQQVAAREGKGREGGDLRLDICRPLLRAVAARKVGLLVQDLAQDRRFHDGDEPPSAKCAMAVPLLRRGQVVGALYLDTTSRPMAFSSEDLELVVGVGVHAAAAVENLRLFRDVEGERKARERVSRFLSPSVVDRVVRSGETLNLGGEKADITVLFADLRGFTPLAERMAPDEVVVMLNEYFELAVELIFKFGGTLDKFIGDAVMAFWGVPVRRSIDSHLTVLAAVKLQAELHCLNERRRKLGKSPLGLGIGIHSGPAVAGNLGTQRRMEYTVIGDTVNLASRIQDLAPPGCILVSEATRERMGNLLKVEAMPETPIQGRKGTVTLHRVHAMYLQEKVAHELRRERRLQTFARVRLRGEDELPSDGVLVDLSRSGAGLVFEDALRFRFDPGTVVSVDLVEPGVPFSGRVTGRVATVREVFERSGTVYLHVGLVLEAGGMSDSLAGYFFGSEDDG